MTTNSNPVALTHFTQPAVLQSVGQVRLAKFLHAFTPDLEAANSGLLPLLASSSPDFTAIASEFASLERLPARLRTTLLTLENAVTPENEPRLDHSIQRRIPNVSLNDSCPIDRALEIWFAAPEELTQFVPEGNLAPVTVDFPPAPGGQSISQPFPFPNDQPWPDPVDASALLDELVSMIKRFVVLPPFAAETLALWNLHTYAFTYRDVSTYIGIESPEKRCGKTTLLNVLAELVHHPVAAANISSSAFFRVIHETRPTLIIDEADTFLSANTELGGILNAGYRTKTAFVMRFIPQSDGTLPCSTSSPLPGKASRPEASQLARFSSWCPKVLATIGRFPDTLADRCILIRMQRKLADEPCERLRDLDTTGLRQKCARFVQDHHHQIASAKPLLPQVLNDRAADIWEPLLVLADLAGGHWPQTARHAAISFASQETNPISSLLLDILLAFALHGPERLFTKTILHSLTSLTDRPWAELRHGKQINELWLSRQLKPYGVKPRTIWIGEAQAKGYLVEDFREIFRRYIPKSEIDAVLHRSNPPQPEPSAQAA